MTTGSIANRPFTVFLVEDDLPDDALSACRAAGVVGCDTETTDLGWRTSALCTVQVAAGEHVWVVRLSPERRPTNVVALLEDPSVQKVFHYALFDLPFLMHHLGATPANVACTRVASRLVDGEREVSHSLQSVLERHLAVAISKEQRLTDWSQPRLHPEQVAYAAEDAAHLPSLLRVLTEQLRPHDKAEDLQSCWDFLVPLTRMRMRGLADPFAR